jgi:hypothetical protein
MANPSEDTAMMTDEEMTLSAPNTFESASEWFSDGNEASGGSSGDWQILVEERMKETTEGQEKDESKEDKKDGGGDDMSIVSPGTNSDDFSFGSDSEIDDEDAKGIVVVPENLFGPKPFDMDLLRKCIEEGEATLKRIEGHDVILVVGKTGVGKSSFVQGIAGKAFYESHHLTQMYGENVEKAVYKVEDPIRGFEIGHSKASMTKVRTQRT